MLTPSQRNSLASGLIGFSLLGAPSASGFEEPVAEPPTPVNPAPEPKEPIELPELPRKEATDLQIRLYVLALAELAKTEPERFPAAAAELEPYSRSKAMVVPFGGFFVRASRLDENISTFSKVFEQSVKCFHESQSVEDAEMHCANLQAILRLFRYDYPQRERIRSMIEGLISKTELQAGDNSAVDRAKISGLSEMLAEYDTGATMPVLTAVADFLVAVHEKHGNDIDRKTYLDSIDDTLDAFAHRRDPSTTGLESLTGLAELTTTVCSQDLLAYDSVTELVSAPARFIAAEPTLQRSQGLKGTEAEKELIDALVAAYTKGVKALHSLPPGRERGFAQIAMFDCGEHLEEIGTVNADRFLDALRTEYMEIAEGDYSGVENFIAAVRYTEPFNPDQKSNETKWGQYPLSKLLADNRTYFLSAIKELHTKVLEAETLADKREALSKSLDIIEWFADLKMLRFRGSGPYTPDAEFARTFYEQISEQKDTVNRWIAADVQTAQAPLFDSLFQLVSTPNAEDGVKPQEQDWFLQQVERACWLEVRLNPASAQTFAEKLTSRIDESSITSRDAAYYRLLQSSVYLELRDSSSESLVDFLMDQASTTRDSATLRELSKTLAMGMLLQDSIRHSEDAIERHIASFGITDRVSYIPRDDRENFVFMQGVVTVEAEKESLAAHLERRETAGSSWQRAHYDLLAIASGDIASARTLLRDKKLETGSAEESTAIAEIRHTSLLLLGYAAIEQESTSYKSAVINSLERNIAVGTPGQWGQRAALLFELYESNWLYGAPERMPAYLENRAEFLQTTLLGDGMLGASELPGAQVPAIRGYLDGLLLKKGASPDTVLTANDEQRLSLLKEHQISAQLPRLEMLKGFLDYIHPDSKRRSIEFLEDIGFSRSDINDPEAVIRILRRFGR